MWFMFRVLDKALNLRLQDIDLIGRQEDCHAESDNPIAIPEPLDVNNSIQRPNQ